MTTATFDRARYGAMGMPELLQDFQTLVGEPPEKKNKLWMLKRMEQAFSARHAAQRAVARARRESAERADEPAEARIEVPSADGSLVPDAPARSTEPGLLESPPDE